ncbi:MAG: universal stress protein, partial [Nitrospirota bacterium]
HAGRSCHPGSHGYSRFMRVLLGSVSELLVREAPASDLIVMGSKGLTGVDRYLLGSVSRRVARQPLVRCWS